MPDAPAPGEAPPGDLPAGWFDEYPTMVWTRKHGIDLAMPSAHRFEIRLRNRNCILEKVVIDLGGVRKSYIGPPENMIVGTMV